jgi:hypothetical protein
MALISAVRGLKHSPIASDISDALLWKKLTVGPWVSAGNVVVVVVVVVLVEVVEIALVVVVLLVVTLVVVSAPVVVVVSTSMGRDVVVVLVGSSAGSESFAHSGITIELATRDVSGKTHRNRTKTRLSVS